MIKSHTFLCPSVQALKSYSIPTSKVRYAIYNIFYLSPKVVSTLDTFYAKEWEASYFMAIMANGTITHQGITYQVIYHKTDPVKLARRAEYVKVLLSFRVPNNLFSIPPTVLVKEIKAHS